MRFLQSESSKVIACISKNLKEIPFQVYLFGSRVDDQKRGGDIDLLLLVSSENFESVYLMKSILKFDLENVLGDQRVDLTLATEQRMKDDIFLASIADEMVSL